MIKAGTVLQDRYLIEKQIGEGGMGAVYLATDRRFDNYVAIKETFYKDDEFGEAFEREANLLNGLIHPVLPHVSDYFTEGGGHFLVMQYIEGEDVSDILKREGAFPVQDVLRWTDSLLDALDYLHSQEPPIIHRDLKPQNLKLTPRGDIFLLDFGLAKFKQEDTSGVKSVFGYSRKYSPLEQIQGVGTDARSDIFALAATVFHLFTGDFPIDAIARASAIVAGGPDPLQRANEINPGIPEAVANVLHSALALNAKARFVSASAMRQALKHASAEYEENIDKTKMVKPLSYADIIAQAVQPVSPEIIPEDRAEWTQNNALPEEAAGGKVFTYAEAMQQALKHAVTKAPEEDVNDQAPEPSPDAPVEDKVIDPLEIQDPPTIYSPENAEFPALAAFAETIETPEKEHADYEMRDNVIRDAGMPETNVQASTPVADNFYKTMTADVPTVAAPRKNRARSMTAGVIALLAIVATVLALVILGNREATESGAPAPEVTASEPVSNDQQPETLTQTVEETKPSDVLKAEKSPVSKTKPATPKKAEENAGVEDEPEKVERVKEISRSKPAKTENKRPPQKSNAGDGERRERVVRSEEVPDIESIFTGRASWGRDENTRRREERRRLREQMTEEEWREYRRQQRRERRRNSYPIPF